MELRGLAAKCDFGQFLERALRDKFVCGIKNEIILKRLLRESNITVTEALELAQAVEAADKNTSIITKKIPDFGQVAKINNSYLKINNSRSMNQNKFQPCSRFVKTYHDKNICFYVDAICHICNEKSHIATVCWSNMKRINVQTVNSEYNITDTKDSDFSQQILQVRNTNSQDLEIKLQLNDEILKFQMDTGSISTIINEQTWKLLR